jgi:hypothetical protein
MDPDSYARNTKYEHGHQTALFMKASQFATRYPELRLMFAIPNGGSRDKREAANLKAEGVKSGVPDVFLPVPRHNYLGLFIELKRPGTEKSDKGAVSPIQRDFWHPELAKQGYLVQVIYGYWDAWACVSWYMGITE